VCVCVLVYMMICVEYTRRTRRATRCAFVFLGKMAAYPISHQLHSSNTTRIIRRLCKDRNTNWTKTNRQTKRPVFYNRACGLIGLGDTAPASLILGHRCLLTHTHTAVLYPSIGYLHGISVCVCVWLLYPHYILLIFTITTQLGTILLTCWTWTLALYLKTVKSSLQLFSSDIVVHCGTYAA